MDFKSCGSESWTILSEIEQRIKNKIEKVGVPLKDWDINIYRGVLTGYNEAFIIDGKKKEEILRNCKTEEERLKTGELIRPILRGRDIKRYGYDFADLWLINTHNGIKEKGVSPINIEDYQAIKEHLDNYYPQLEKRADKGDTPYNLRNCAYLEDFSKQKIIFQEMVQEPSFILDNGGIFFCLDTGRIITGEAVKHLIAVFNSKLFFFAVKHFYGGGGLGKAGVRMKHTFFEKFHCSLFNTETKREIEKLLQKQDYQKIDYLIYKMYNLDKNEIEIIDSQ